MVDPDGSSDRPARRVDRAQSAMLDPRAASFLEDLQAVMCESTRAQIVLALHAAPLNVTEVCSALTCSKWTASRHLRVLRESGIVVASRRGRQVFYRLDDGPVVGAALAALRAIDGVATN